jgi:hypothetical protein
MLNNKWILYAVLLISIVDLFNFFSMGDTTSIAIFIVVGFLTTYFSKNMLVVLVLAIAVTHIARYGAASIEGMASEAEGEEEEKEDTEEGMEGEEEEEEPVDEGMNGEKADGGKADGEKADGGKADGLKNIAESLKTIEAIHPDEAANQTATLIEQTKKVQENMAMLEPYLKQAEKATAPLTKSEGFCDYSSAYKR